MAQDGDRQPEQMPPDRGAGYLTVTLDHATGQVRVGYDNLLPEELVNLASALQAYATRLFQETERQRLRAEIEAELQRKAGKTD